MPKLSSEERDGLLAAVGETALEAYETDEETEQDEWEEAPDNFIGSEQQEMFEEEEEEVDEEQEEDIDPNLALVEATAARMFEQEAPPQEQQGNPELDRLRQQVYQLEQTLQQRLYDSEQEIRNQQQQPEESFTDVDWRDPSITRVIAEELDLDEERAQRLGPLMGNVARLVVDNTVGKELQVFKEEAARRAEQERQYQASQAYYNNVRSGIQYAIQTGGLEGAVAQNFLDKKQNSLLAQHLKRFPSKLASPEGVMDAVVSVARSVEIMNSESGDIAQRAARPQQPVRGSRQQVSAALTKQVTNDPTTPEPELTEEEKIKLRIRNVEPNLRKRLPGFFD